MLESMDEETKLLEAVAAPFETKIRATVPSGEECLIQVYSDLTTEGLYGSQWVVVTRQRVVVLPEKGEDGAVVVPMEEIQVARTEGLVGGGCLEIERKDEPTVRVPYSSTLAVKFSESC